MMNYRKNYKVLLPCWPQQGSTDAKDSQPGRILITFHPSYDITSAKRHQLTVQNVSPDSEGRDLSSSSWWGVSRFCKSLGGQKYHGDHFGKIHSTHLPLVSYSVQLHFIDHVFPVLYYRDLLGMLAHWGWRNKIPQTGWLYQQKCVFSQLQKLKVRNQGVGRCGFS